MFSRPMYTAAMNLGGMARVLKAKTPKLHWLSHGAASVIDKEP